MKNTRLVYSTETGRICPECRNPVSGCSCKGKGKKKAPRPHAPVKADGVVRIRRETKGRKGKTVTTAHGFDLDDTRLKALAKQLKRHCGTGGSIKAGVIVVQGDHRAAIEAFLRAQGYTVKNAG